MDDLNKRISTLTEWLFNSRYPVVFTGAGISTESGLRDFRGPDGLWTRRDKGLSTPHQDFTGAEPNSGHMAILELQNMGKMEFLISQNVDNLHLKSGIRPDLLAELHGNIAKLRCRRCGTTMDKKHKTQTCQCGGSLNPSVVDFGQSLPEQDLMNAYHHSERADLFIVVGSSLVVTPAAHMPAVALKSGAKLVIINEGDTPFDQRAHLRFRERAGMVLPRSVGVLRERNLREEQ